MPALVSSRVGSLGTRLDDGSGVWPLASKKPRKARRSSSAVMGFITRQAIRRVVGAGSALPWRSMTHDPGWYPDPSGRHEHRYWDGSGWTEHVASHGRQGVDPEVGSAPPP